MSYKKNHVTNPQGGRVTRSQEGERFRQYPSADKIHKYTLDKETDTFETIWGAENSYFILDAINREVRNYNNYVIGKEETKFNKPIPYFKTLTAFLFWIEDTNPKALKEFMRELFLSVSNADKGEAHTDGLLYYNDLGDYFKGLHKYMTEAIVLIPEKEEEE